MRDLIGLLMIVFFFLFIIGLIKPSMVRLSSRKKSFFIFGAGWLFFTFLLPSFFPTVNAPKAASLQDEKPKIDIFNHNGPLVAVITDNKSDNAGNSLHFNNIESMMEDFNDFPPDRGSFILLSKKPLKIQLSPQIIPAELKQPEYVVESMQRALVYGVYRSFIHTDVNSISVTVKPEVIDLDNKTKKYAKGFILKTNITRDRALSLAKKYAGVSSFEDLTGDDGYKWVDSFSNCCYWRSSSASFKSFISELSSDK